MMSGSPNVSKNINVENEKKLERMKTSILRMMETKDLATQENTTLRRYKSSMEKLKQENKRLKAEIESLNKRVEVRCKEEMRQSPDGKENTGTTAENDPTGKVKLFRFLLSTKSYTCPLSRKKLSSLSPNFLCWSWRKDVRNALIVTKIFLLAPQEYL